MKGMIGILIALLAPAFAAHASAAPDDWKRLEGTYHLAVEESDAKCLPASTLELRVSLEINLIGTLTQEKDVPVEFFEINKGPKFYYIHDVPGADNARWGWTMATWNGQVLEAT